MALPKALEHEYIISNIFLNILSIFKILAPKRKVFNGLYLCRKILYLLISREGQ